MQQAVQTFTFAGVVPSNLTIVERDGEPWFIAADVCAILSLGNPTEAVRPLDDDEKLTSVILRAGQMRPVNLINESGLYALIIRSNKPNAKAFRKWVTGTVLPSIRKTGSFTVAPAAQVTNFVQRFNDNFMQVEPGYFSVLSELFIILHGRFEKAGYQIPDKSLMGIEIRPDVSVGKGFAAHLDKNLPMAKDWHKPYYHKFPNGTEFPARQYEDTLLADYRKYVLFEWIPKHAEKYFTERDKKALEYLPFLLTGPERERLNLLNEGE